MGIQFVWTSPAPVSNGDFDARALSAAFLNDALRLLFPYADDCISCARKVLDVFAFDAIATIAERDECIAPLYLKPDSPGSSKLTLTMALEADSNGFVDGREVAKELVVLSARLLLAIASCPGCVEENLATVADEELGKLESRAEQNGRFQPIVMCFNTRKLSDAELRVGWDNHLSQAAKGTARLLGRFDGLYLLDLPVASPAHH